MRWRGVQTGGLDRASGFPDMVRSERLLGWLLGRTLISEGRSRNVKVCWMHMKAIRVSHFGGPDHLVLKDQEVVPTAQREGTAVVKVFSAGVNPVDTYIRSGVYGKLPDLPYTPGTDGAGVVTEVGKGTHKVKVGDRVFVTSVLGPRGTYAQYCLAMESNVHILPDNVSFDAGAAIGVPYRTAYRAMFHSAGVSSDQRVFVHGASGGVGLAAVQMARVRSAIGFCLFEATFPALISSTPEPLRLLSRISVQR